MHVQWGVSYIKVWLGEGKINNVSPVTICLKKTKAFCLTY